MEETQVKSYKFMIIASCLAILSICVMAQTIQWSSTTIWSCAPCDAYERASYILFFLSLIFFDLIEEKNDFLFRTIKYLCLSVMYTACVFFFNNILRAVHNAYPQGFTLYDFFHEDLLYDMGLRYIFVFALSFAGFMLYREVYKEMKHFVDYVNLKKLKLFEGIELNEMFPIQIINNGKLRFRTLTNKDKNFLIYLRTYGKFIISESKDRIIEILSADAYAELRVSVYKTLEKSGGMYAYIICNKKGNPIGLLTDAVYADTVKKEFIHDIALIVVNNQFYMISEETMTQIFEFVKNIPIHNGNRYDSSYTQYICTRIGADGKRRKGEIETALHQVGFTTKEVNEYGWVYEYKIA